MTRLPPCPYMVKTLKIFFSRTRKLLIQKLGMQHWGLKLYKVYINGDPGLTLTYFMARSNWVAYTFEWGKLLHSHLMGENLQQRTILNETSKPPLNIFSNISAYIKRTKLKFTLNMDTLILESASKFHYHKLTLKCTFHLHTNFGI